MKIKSCREHTLEAIQRKPTICSNCDSSDAKFICRECDPTCCYLCVGCSVIHPKIKAFRGHQVVSIQSNSIARKSTINFRLPTSWDDLNVTLTHAIDTIHINLTTLTWSDALFWKTVAAVLLCTLTYYSIVRTLFASYSSIVNMAVAIGLYQWFQSTRSLGLTKAEQSAMTGKADPADRATALLQRTGTVSGQSQPFGKSSSGVPRGWNISLDQFDKDQFKGEFWYSLEDKKASLRPRGRPYRRGPAAQQTRQPQPPGESGATHDVHKASDATEGPELCPVNS